MAELDIKALKRLKDGTPTEAYSGHALIAEIYRQQEAIIAALEDRERLREAAGAVYVDEAGFCHGLGKLRAALEGRDG